MPTHTPTPVESCGILVRETLTRSWVDPHQLHQLRQRLGGTGDPLTGGLGLFIVYSREVARVATHGAEAWVAEGRVGDAPAADPSREHGARL